MSDDLEHLLYGAGPWQARLRACDPVLLASVPGGMRGAALACLEHCLDTLEMPADPRISARVRGLVWGLLLALRQQGAGACVAAAMLGPGGPAAVFWRLSDRIWVRILTQDGGLAFYSRRAILASVLSACVFYQRAGRSEADVAAFLDRRLAEVAMLGRLRRARRSR